jgi:hypothetical protein
MSTILERITRRLHTIREMAGDTSWRDPRNPNYDRQWAEDALYHTLGPLTDTPRWLDKWTSPSEPVPGFTPGGPAPRWTPEEVVFAMAGDPQLAFQPGGKDNPRSPAYGRQGGSPLWRTARRVARVYARDRDNSFIADMYSNGFIPLVRMMQPGFDEGRSPFISYTIRTIQGAMEHGVGGTNEAIRAQGGESTTGLSGLKSLLDAKTPEEARRIAGQVKGKYQTGKSHDKNPDNPFGPFSSRIYQIATEYATALEGGDKEQIERVRNRITQLNDEIDDTQTLIPGASTGMGQAISTPDRQTSIGVSSMDVQRDDEQGTMAGNIPTDDNADSWIDPETVHYILDIALAHDVTRLMQSDPQLAVVATQAGLKAGEKLGRMTANELRYIIRQLGPLGSNYPGKGKPRKATTIPRDAKGWWQPLEDPEIEPIPAGGLWHSIWSRDGYQAMGSTAIAQEMTEEVREFTKLGIPTARKIQVKAKVQEAISKVSVSNTIKSAFIKLKIIATLHRQTLGMDESRRQNLHSHGFPLMEDVDPVDRRLIIETWDFIFHTLARNIIEEKETPVNFSQPAKQVIWSK